MITSKDMASQHLQTALDLFKGPHVWGGPYVKGGNGPGPHT